MVQAGKTRQERKEAVLWAEDLSSIFPTRVLFVLRQVNIYFDSSTEGQRFYHITKPQEGKRIRL